MPYVVISAGLILSVCIALRTSRATWRPLAGLFTRRAVSAQEGWFKSSFSSGQTECVSVRFADGQVYVRSDRDPGGPMLVFDRSEWEAFLLGAFAGEFEMPL